MRMHLAYYGAAPEAISYDRRSNYLDYSNETDNFNQPHYQLHNIYKLSDRATLSNTLYFIRGKGYYEQLKRDADYRLYDINPPYRDITDTTGNLVRQQWVYKSQFGWNPRLDIEHKRGTHSLGGSFYYFDSDHWGQVVWAEHIREAFDPRYKYYEYYGKKYVGSFYATETYALTEKLKGQATAQGRYQRYRFNQNRMGEYPGYRYDLDWFFFSPRLGMNYTVNPSLSAYVNAAVSSRTPTDAEIYDAGDPEAVPQIDVKSERVVDLELGSSYRREKYAFGVNLFWMDFRDEIIPQGGINPNTGLAITVNADRSIHSGIEFTGRVTAIEHLDISGNLAINHNRVKEFKNAFPYAATGGDSLYTVDFKDREISGFPNYLANLVLDYKTDRVRATWRLRAAGRQYMELYNIDLWKIDAYSVSSLSLSYRLADIMGLGRFTLSATVDNLFDKKFNSSGYGGNYVNHFSDGSFSVGGWAEYFVAAERNFFVQIEMELF
jgi:iron complex outermembrane receptor protein